MLIACVLIFLLIAVVATILIFHTHSEAAESTIYDQSAQSIDLEAYSATILPETTDAGQSYLDETLFIGDSNTVRLYRFGLISLENYMGQEGMGIEGVPASSVVYFKSSASAYSIPDAVKLVQPRRIVMMFGTNNASGANSVDSFISTYRKSIETIQSAYPYSDIIIAAIPPRCRTTDYPDVQMSLIDAFNKALIDLAEEMNLKFLNTSEVLKDDTGYGDSTLFDADGLHFSLKGAETFLTYVRTHAWVTEDSRPAVTNVPERVAPPESVSSSVASSSSQSSSASSSESPSESLSQSSSVVSSASNSTESSSAPSSATSSQASSSQTSSSPESSQASESSPEADASSPEAGNNEDVSEPSNDMLANSENSSATAGNEA